MSQLRHDYSKHTVDELGHEVSTLDVRTYSDRAAGLCQELYRRLTIAQEDVERAQSEQALVVGARFDQLDRQTRRRFFWPYLGLNAAFAFGYSVAIALAAAFIAGIVLAVRRSNGVESSDPTLIIQLIIAIVLMVPVSAWWLAQLTKRTFGGYCLRIVPKRE